MQTIALESFTLVAVSVFVVMMVAMVRCRVARGPENPYISSAAAEYLFALVPWLILIAGALPSVRKIMAQG
jgi:heme/copper-type cytochrome/quinol oxidase subunit 2